MSKQKTALFQLIQKLDHLEQKERKYFISNEMVRELCNELLEVEREHLIEAFKSGQIFEGREQGIWLECENWFNNKYRTDGE